MKDRYATIRFGTRVFPIIIAGDDPHDWRLLNESEKPEFDEAWNEMEARMRRRAA